MDMDDGTDISSPEFNVLVSQDSIGEDDVLMLLEQLITSYEETRQ